MKVECNGRWASTFCPSWCQRVRVRTAKVWRRSCLSRCRHNHDLRHTHATLLLKAGVPVKVVSERLGHSNPAFTMSVYQHVIPGMQADAAALFSALIAPRDAPGPSQQ
jgi:integrase